jgi:DNA-binding CsgD family transcriptional regulator
MQEEASLNMDRKLTRDARGCVPIGSLSEFVQALDEGASSRSLHQLAGQLHMTVGDDAAREQWLASVRERFAASQAASFEIDLNGREPEIVIASPSDRSPHSIAVSAMKAALQSCNAGEAVLYDSRGEQAPREGSMCLSAAAVRVQPARAIGIVLVRPHDAVGSGQAVLQYLAALAWHLKCADAANGKMRALSLRLSPLDLLDLVPLPCMITDAAGRALERNDGFNEMMEAAGLNVVTGRLRFEDSYLQDSWQVALSEVDATAVAQSLLASAPDGRQWRLHLTPLRCALDPEDTTGRQMILVMAEANQVLPEAPMMAAPQMDRPLTPAESEVLGAMLQGHSAKVIANSRGASVNTVRSQIMSILEKTGFHNQKTLMASFSTSTFGASTNSAFQISTSRRPSTFRRT